MKKIFLYILSTSLTGSIANAQGSDPSSFVSINVRGCGLVSSSDVYKEARIERLNQLGRRKRDQITMWLDQRDIEKGKFSDYWAQELIGVDLLREELKKEPAPMKENFIAIFDSGGEPPLIQSKKLSMKQWPHGILVKNLISDEGPHAVLPEIGDRIVHFKVAPNSGFSIGPGEKPPSKREMLDGFFKTADSLKNQVLPAFINNSNYWMEFSGIYDIFRSLSPPPELSEYDSSRVHPDAFASPAVVVVATENEYPLELDIIKSKASKDFDVILVGSFSPGGFVSAFSQEGEEVHILAPSDHLLSAVRDGEQPENFGGTSGAAPLVTGSLAGFEWLSGYHPTPEEAKILLEKTAIPTMHIHERSKRNGTGLVNGYKLGMVGKRLKQKCVNQPSDCFGTEIRRKKSYYFSQPVGLQTDLQSVFPECVEKRKMEVAVSEGSCDEKRRLAARLAGNIRGEAGDKILEKLAEDPHFYVQRLVKYILTRSNEN